MAKSTSLLCCIAIFLFLRDVNSSQEPVWCVASQSATDDQLQAFIDFACGKIEACRYIQPGAVCYEPNTVRDHGSYILDSYWAVFNVCNPPIGVITYTDPCKLLSPSVFCYFFL